jgi:hypothetical protein
MKSFKVYFYCSASLPWHTAGVKKEDKGNELMIPWISTDCPLGQKEPTHMRQPAFWGVDEKSSKDFCIVSATRDQCYDSSVATVMTGIFFNVTCIMTDLCSPSQSRLYN